MNYNESLEYTHSLLKFGIKPGLERISALLEALGNPHKQIKAIHIAGTNGKGSTCSFIASALKTNGYETGLFISPYVIDFRERIQINGEFIKENDFAEIATTVKIASDKLGEKYKPTEFEFITAVAFKYFLDKKCDVCVIETGLGGRFDSTNVLESPLCSVITHIDLDHMTILGDTIGKIAFEKSGIIKENCPVITTVMQTKEAIDVIKNTALKKQSPFYMAETFDGELSLIGNHQKENAGLALNALKVCGLKIDSDLAVNSFRNTHFPARCEILCHEPLLILDGSHNPNGADALVSALMSMTDQKFSAVIGMMEDKNINDYLSIISKCVSEAICVEVKSNSRSISAEKLSKKAERIINKVSVAKNYDEALEKIKNKNYALICGSLYLASDIRVKAQKLHENK